MLKVAERAEKLAQWFLAETGQGVRAANYGGAWGGSHEEIVDLLVLLCLSRTTARDRCAAR